eukprot:9494891-Pyramimonas_sp.AAC.1
MAAEDRRGPPAGGAGQAPSRCRSERMPLVANLEPEAADAGCSRARERKRKTTAVTFATPCHQTPLE